MFDRVNSIYARYTDLEYDKNNINDVYTYISTLSQKVTSNYKKDDYNNFAKRFSNTAFVIKENLAYFSCCCQHIDEITTIVEYLSNFDCQLNFYNLFDNEYTIDEVIKAIILTLFSICTDPEVLQFLKNALVKDSKLEKYGINDVSLSQTINEMILLEDADLYAVVSYLKMTTAKYHSTGMKIWVQRLIKEKFLFLKEKYLKDQEISVCAFKSTKDLSSLFTSKIFDAINIISIWSEDIVVATNLAVSLNRDIVFINTYMDFSGGTILLPHIKLVGKTLYWPKHSKCSLDVCPLKADTQSNDKYRKLTTDPCCQDVFRNLFYDGMWQIPVKEMYWIHTHTDTYNELWANATCDDINRCINSAEKGFKIWSVMPTKRRSQILLKFISLLKHNRKFELKSKIGTLNSNSNFKLNPVMMISKLIHFLNTCEKSLSGVQNGRLEVMTVRQPRGVIVIKEKDALFLFLYIIESLLAGNSVIVICDFRSSNLDDLMSYWKTFPLSDIPPGVVNLLSSKKSKEMELILCGTDYESYAKRFFTENELSTYMNLTLPKHIVRSFK